MIDGRNFFDQKVKSNLRTYDNIKKTATSECSDFTTGCYPYLIKCYKLIAIDLSKQQKLNADPKAIQQINVTGYLSSATMKVQQCFSLLTKQKKQFQNFQKEPLKYYDFILFSYNINI